MTLNAYLNRFRSAKGSNCAILRNTWDILTALFPVLRGVCDGKYLLKIPGNGISETLNFKMSLDASALRNLCLLCVFQSCLLFIISLLLKNVLTAQPHSFNNIIMENQTISCFCSRSLLSFFLFLLVSNVCVYISLFTWHFWYRFPATIQREGFRGKSHYKICKFVSSALGDQKSTQYVLI